MSISSGAGAVPSFSVSQDMARRAMVTPAPYGGQLMHKREAMVECPCECGQVISVSPPTASHSSSASGGLAGFSINSGAGSVSLVSVTVHAHWIGLHQWLSTQ